MRIKLEYKPDSKKLWVGIEPKMRGDLPIRDLNYYAVKAVFNMEFTALSQMAGVEKVLEEQEYLERELHHALEAQMAIYAHLFVVETMEQAKKIADAFAEKMRFHYGMIKKFSSEKNELTKATDVPMAEIVMMFNEVKNENHESN